MEEKMRMVQDDIWIAERVPVRLVAQALITIALTRRPKRELRKNLLWVVEAALHRGYRRLIWRRQLVRFRDVDPAATAGEIRGYRPSPELGLYFCTHRGVEVFIMPRSGISGGLQYNVACNSSPDVSSVRYREIFRRAGVELHEVLKAPAWLKAAQEAIAKGLQQD